MHNSQLMKARQILLFPLFATLLFAHLTHAAEAYDWTFEYYEAGRLDTIQSVLNKIPQNTPAGEFFRAVFEEDGEEARYHYDRILALWLGSNAEPWALERLWQYHWAKGDIEQAKKFYGLLESRHPGHSALRSKPDFSSDGGLVDLAAEKVPQIVHSPKPVIEETKPDVEASDGNWTVQLGAFSKREGAQNVARKVADLCPVDLKEKEVNGKTLVIVQAGSFAEKSQAYEFADKIAKERGIRGRVLEK